MSRRTWREGWWSHADARSPSPNHNKRPSTDITLVVVHSISLPPGVFGGDEVLQFFANALDHDAHPYFQSLRGVRVSAHFFVRRDGRVHQCVSVDDRAWHAGASTWRGRADCNDHSVGVELEGLEGGAFEDAQYAALARLIRSLRRVHPIDSVVGHEHIAPARKRDPGAGFLWERLRVLSRLPMHMCPPHAMHLD